MQLQFSFKHMEASEAVRTYATEKTERLRKYFQGRITVEWNFSVEKQNRIAHCHVTGNHMDYFGEGVTDDMRASVELAVDKVETQLRRHKEVLTSHKVGA